MDFLPAKHQLDVLPPIADPKHFALAASFHAVSVIERPVAVDAQRKFKIGLSGVLFGSPFLLERNDQQVDVIRAKPVFVLSQLRQMLATRKSREMAMKNQQQPPSTIIDQLVFVAVDVGQFKW